MSDDYLRLEGNKGGFDQVHLAGGREFYQKYFPGGRDLAGFWLFAPGLPEGDGNAWNWLRHKPPLEGRVLNKPSRSLIEFLW